MHAMSTRILRTLLTCALLTFPLFSASQNAAPPAGKPTEHVLGTVTALDSAAHTVTVKDDKTAAESIVSVAGTKTLLKVAPNAKDLKGAVRITADDLAVGDRVDVRGFKSEAAPAAIDARSVVLMSARDLAEKRQAEAEAWQNSTVGTITAAGVQGPSFAVTTRTPEGPKPLAVQTSDTTEWTRYSPANPKTPVASSESDLQPGDQVRILGQKTSDGSSIAAEKIYSAPVRTVAATITSLSPDGSQIVAKNLESKQPVTFALAADTAVRKLDPQMAAMLAHRFGQSSPGQNAAAGSGGGRLGSAGSPGPAGPAGSPGPAATTGAPAGSAHSPAGGSDAPGGPGMRAGGGGNLARLLERTPTITASDLKPGDAVVVWGMAGGSPGLINAHTVLAGVEPVLQSAPVRQGQALGGDWGLDAQAPAQ